MMALEQITFNIGAFNDANAGGNNYYAGLVFEVKKQSDNTFASIYSDASGSNQIPQNGIDNVSNTVGECVFWVDYGDYYIEVDGKTKLFSTLISASEVIFSDGSNSQDFKNQVSTNLDEANAELSILNKAPSINMNVTSLPVGLEQNQVGSNQDRHIMLFGDSHGWGQGAPQYDLIGAPSSNVSVHSAPIANKGFMSRIKSFLDEKMNAEINHYGAGTNQITSDMTISHAGQRNAGDPENTYPIVPIGGNVSSTYQPMGDASETNEKWFAPDTRVGNGDDYSYNAYREKLQGGLFTRAVMKLEQATEDDYTTIGRDRYWEILPSKNTVTFGAGYVDIVHQNLSSGASADPILGARDSVTGRVWVNSAMKKPQWLKDDAEVFVPGFGYMLIGNAGLVNDSVEFTMPNGDPATTEFSKLVASGMKIYPAALARGLLMIEMRKPARAMYLHVIEKAGGGTMRVGFVNNISNGYVGYPQIDETAIFTRSANPWAQRLSSGTMGVFKVEPDSNLTSNPANVTRDNFGFKLDTDNGGAEKEVVYRVDFGSQQQGRLFIAFDTVENTLGTETFETRGVVFDNNKTQNYSMGGHTVGAWLGEEESFSSETRAHIDDILNYTPVQPSHVITQVPFVNEYLKQTPISTFKTRLQTFVDKFENHLDTSNNYNTVGVDFMFFTSLRNRDIAFNGAAEDPVTYDMYVQATKEFCEDNNHAFVDCEAKLFDLVENGLVSYERLFNNSNHPSDYANEIIFEQLKGRYLYTMV